MPFLQEYECFEKHHRFEYMHMGSRDTLPEIIACEFVVETSVDYVCEHKSGTADLVEAIPVAQHSRICGYSARPIISAPGAIQTIVKGNGDYDVRERERLEQRAAEHGRTKNEMDRRRDLLERRLRQGYPVNPIKGV